MHDHKHLEGHQTFLYLYDKTVEQIEVYSRARNS